MRLRTTCRVCNRGDLELVLSLGEQYVSNFVDGSSGRVLKAPLELVLCAADKGGCGLLQLRHTVDKEEMYRNYWYRSGVNETMKRALADVTKQAEKIVHLKPGEMVIDIGSNDNTLFKAYRVANLCKIGFEPARTILPYAQEGATCVVNDYFSEVSFDKLGLKEKAKVITAIAMFYDLEDPNQFVADAKSCLAKDGVLIIQQAYLPLMLKDNIFDNICHEHLEYYCLLSLEALLARHDLEVVDVELNDVNGGSFRTYIAQRGSRLKNLPAGAEQRVKALRSQEEKLQLHKTVVYAGFADRVENIKQEVTEFIRAEAASGKIIYVYGASTKGNTLLQYFGLDNTVITAAAERNPDKWGRRTVGTNIPIVSEEAARAAEPDYFLVLPWHFLPEFKEREKEFLSRGGKFIAPLPQFAVIG